MKMTTDSIFVPGLKLTLHMRTVMHVSAFSVKNRKTHYYQLFYPNKKNYMRFDQFKNVCVNCS
jgi:hypothetical protein